MLQGLPFVLISGEDFTNFSQTLLNMRAYYGNISTCEILPLATKISRHVLETGENIGNNLILS